MIAEREATQWLMPSKLRPVEKEKSQRRAPESAKTEALPYLLTVSKDIQEKCEGLQLIEMNRIARVK